MIQYVLCGWYIYMAVLSGLMSLSAGPRTRFGRLSALATLVCAALVAMIWRPMLPVWPVDIGPYESINLGGLLPHLGVLGVGLAGLLAAPRQDTRLIALLLGGAALLPVVLFFCSFDGGLSCRP